MTVFDSVLRGVRDAAAWIDATIADAAVDYSRYYKEVYLMIGRRGGEWDTVVAVKVSERRWYATANDLRRMAVGLLRRGKERGRRVVVILVVYRMLTSAFFYAQRRLRWAHIVPLRLLADKPRAILGVVLREAARHAGRLYARVYRLLAERVSAAIEAARAALLDLILSAARLRRVRLRAALRSMRALAYTRL